MQKKVWTGVAASTLALSLLAGCGGTSGGTTGGNQAAGGTDASKGPVTIRLYTHGTESAYNWKNTLSAFEAKNPGIKVELVQLSEKGDSQEAMKKLDLAAASGEAMDVLMFSDTAGYAQRVALGMAAPLDEYIAKEGYKEQEEYKIDTSLNGKVYALPGKFNPWYVLLNKNQLDEAGLKVPTDWTWDQFAEYAKKLTKGEGSTKRYGTYFHGPQGGGWTEYLKLMMENQPVNADFLKPDGTSNLDNPNYKKTLELRVKMEKEDKSAVPYADLISQKLAYRTQFYGQSASMIVIGSWMNSELGGTDQMPLNFNLAVAPFPKNNPGDPNGLTPVGTDFVSVAAASKHKEEAYKFVRWYTTDGQIAQGKNIPSWSKVKAEDMSKMIDTILSTTKNPDKVDKASLITTMQISKSSQVAPPQSYQAEVYKALNEEFEKLIFGKQDVDATVKSSQDRVNQIIAANKK
ncbi:ABC transporter substrate-binding protein [Paenibacillus cremeus]|uniref:Sugar ABC transporter substrate-binding protein n=1 Tax=Paenibacillus cremeus TaxID=2163881 RepID=A0A559JK38_9BACL|nr:sugar ABC transporter substrate-binding protein [Paenibacillus cremeus]TVY00258.1 sugar ABC transporter substrate-binding protein [Paenibacillus cremeus]